MAFLTCHFQSVSLGRNVTFHAVIPGDRPADLPTLYLFHGLSDDSSAWERRTSAERYAEERGLALIMPDGGRSFYTDSGEGEYYFSYVSLELVEYTRALFPLSRDREKTFAGGNSMGGYGAVKCALARPDTFGACVTLSGALDLVTLVKTADWMQALSVHNWGKDCHDAVAGTGDDLFALADRLAADKSAPKPRMMQICGTEDFLYEINRTFRRRMENLPFDYRYEESPGTHDWAFWDRNLPAAMDFLLKR